MAGLHFDVHFRRNAAFHFGLKREKEDSGKEKWMDGKLFPAEVGSFTLMRYRFSYVYITLACRYFCFLPWKVINNRTDSGISGDDIIFLFDNLWLWTNALWHRALHGTNGYQWSCRWKMVRSTLTIGVFVLFCIFISSSSGWGITLGSRSHDPRINPCPSLVSVSQKMSGELKTGWMPVINFSVLQYFKRWSEILRHDM